jgi:hypothetical protein
MARRSERGSGRGTWALLEHEPVCSHPIEIPPTAVCRSLDGNDPNTGGAATPAPPPKRDTLSCRASLRGNRGARAACRPASSLGVHAVDPIAGDGARQQTDGISSASLSSYRGTQRRIQSAFDGSAIPRGRGGRPRQRGQLGGPPRPGIASPQPGRRGEPRRQVVDGLSTSGENGLSRGGEGRNVRSPSISGNIRANRERP